MKTWGELKAFMESHSMPDETEITLSVALPTVPSVSVVGKFSGAHRTDVDTVTLRGRGR